MRTFSSPGITFGARRVRRDVRDLEEVGWKNSLPSSQMGGDQLGERRRKAVHGILGEMRVGDVALHAVHGEPARQGAATADLDRVAELGRARWGSPTTHQSIFSPRASSTSTTFLVPSTDGPSSSLVSRKASEPHAAGGSPRSARWP
jgi:hypothetical protein